MNRRDKRKKQHIDSTSIEFLREESGTDREGVLSGRSGPEEKAEDRKKRRQQDFAFLQAEKQEAEKAKKGPRGVIVLVIVAFAVYLLSITCVVSRTSFDFTFAYALSVIRRNLADLVSVLTGGGSHHAFSMRMKEYLMIALVGMALSAGGAMYKSIFRNVLAAPTTMGIQQGGILGIMAYLGIVGGAVTAETSGVTGGGNIFARVAGLTIFQNYGQIIFIFAGSFIGVILVALIATTAGHGKLSSAVLVLAGTVVNGAIAGIVGSIQYYMSRSTGDDDIVLLLQQVMNGSFDHLYLNSTMFTMLAVFLPCMIWMYFLSDQMNLYALGDEQATALGVNIKALRGIVIVLVVIMTALTMVYCGHIAFVGFIVPQFIRKAAGPDFRRYYLFSVIMGAIFTMLVYDVALIIGMTDGLSLITTVIGSIMMIYILLNKRGSANAVVS